VQSNDEVDAEILRATTDATGAVVMGRRLFDFVDGPHGRSDEMGYGAGLAGTAVLRLHALGPRERPAWVALHLRNGWARVSDQPRSRRCGVEGRVS
jgi:hypothetical protein